MKNVYVKIDYDRTRSNIQSNIEEEKGIEKTTFIMEAVLTDKMEQRSPKSNLQAWKMKTKPRYIFIYYQEKKEEKQTLQCG